MTSASSLYRLAICGAGPAGLACLKTLATTWIHKYDSPRKKLRVDVFEAALVPLGLIRLGVAPDHISIKAVGESLISANEKFVNPAKANFAFEFYGGVSLGQFLDLESLRRHYDAVILTTGSAGYEHRAEQALKLKVPGESATGIVCAEEVIEWYNGQALAPPRYLYEVYKKVPGVMRELGNWTMDSHMLNYSLARSSSVSSTEDGYRLSKLGRLLDPQLRANKLVVFGNGNVAADIVRVFLKDPDVLDCRHLAPAGRDLLSRLHSNLIDEFYIIGRRGPLQATWELHSLRELFDCHSNVRVLVPTEDFKVSVVLPEIGPLIRNDRAARRTLSLIENAVGNYEALITSHLKHLDLRRSSCPAPPETDIRNLWLRFCMKPVKFLTEPSAEGVSQVTGVQLARTRLMKAGRVRNLRDLQLASESEGTAVGEAGAAPPKVTELVEGVRLVVKALGYGIKGGVRPSRAWLDYVPGEDQQHIGSPCRNRVIDREGDRLSAVYSAGWLRSGGRGSLASTIIDGKKAAQQVLSELVAAGARPPKSGQADQLVNNLIVPEMGIPVSWQEAMALMQWEKATGHKLANWTEAVDLVNEVRASSKQGPRKTNYSSDFAEYT